MAEEKKEESISVIDLEKGSGAYGDMSHCPFLIIKIPKIDVV